MEQHALRLWLLNRLENVPHLDRSVIRASFQPISLPTLCAEMVILPPSPCSIWDARTLISKG